MGPTTTKRNTGTEFQEQIDKLFRKWDEEEETKEEKKDSDEGGDKNDDAP